MIITVDDARQYSLSNPVLYTPPVSKPITKSTTPQYISSSPVTSPSTLKKTTLVIVLVVPGGALLILIIVVIIVMICCCCRRKKSQTEQPPEDDNGNTAYGEVDEICVKNPLYRDSKLDPPLDYTPTVPRKTGEDAATNPVLKRVQKQSGVYSLNQGIGQLNQGIGQQSSNISRHDKSIKGDYTPRIYNDTLSDQVRTRQAKAQSGMYTGTITPGGLESADNQISNIQGYSEEHHISPAHSADGSYRTANADGPALNVTLADSSNGEFQYKQKLDYKSNSQPQSKVNSFPPVIHELEHKNVEHPAIPHIPEMDHASPVSASEATDAIYDAIDGPREPAPAIKPHIKQQAPKTTTKPQVPSSYLLSPVKSPLGPFSQHMNVSIPLKHVKHDAQSSSADGFHPKKKHMSPPHSADGVIRHNPPFTYIHNTPTTKKPNGKYAADSVGKDERLYEEIDPHVKKRVEVSHLDRRTQNRHVGKQRITLDTVEDESSDDYDDALTLQPAISPGVKPAAYFYGGEEIDPHVKKRVEVSHLDKRTQNRHVGKQSITLDTVEDESSDDYDDALTLQPAISPGVKPAAYFYGGEEIDPHVKKRVEVSHLDKRTQNRHVGKQSITLDTVEDESSDDYDDALTLQPAISPGVKPAAYFYGGDHASKDGHLGRGLAVHGDGGIYEELGNLPNPPPIPVVRTPVTDDVYQDNQVGDDDDIYQDDAVADEDDIYKDDAVANTTVPIRRRDRFQSAEDEAIARSSLFQQEKTDEVSTSIASIMASPNNTRPQQFFFHTAATHRKGRKPWM